MRASLAAAFGSADHTECPAGPRRGTLKKTTLLTTDRQDCRFCLSRRHKIGVKERQNASCFQSPTACSEDSRADPGGASARWHLLYDRGPGRPGVRHVADGHARGHQPSAGVGHPPKAQAKGLVVRHPDPLHLLSRSLPSLVASPEDWRDLAQLRYALEVGAIELAVRAATDQQIERLGQIEQELEQALQEDPIGADRRVGRSV